MLKKSSLILLLTILMAAPMHSATFIVPTDTEMVRRADAIVVASALESHPQLTPEGSVETVTPIDVHEVIKGAVLRTTLDIHEPGGELGGRATIIPGVPRFERGADYLLFLTRTPRGLFAVTDLVLGKFRFATDAFGQHVAVRDAEEIVGWDADGRPHQETHRDADAFLRFVRETAEGARANTDYRVPVHPLATLFRGSISRFQVSTTATYSATSYTFAVSGSLGARWNVFPNAVSFYVGPTLETGAPGGGVTAIQTGIASWNNDCASNVNYVYAGQDSTHTAGLSGPDGVNTVQFERNLSSYGIPPFSCSSSGYSGTLGIGGVTSASGTHTSPSGETFMTTQEGDVEMNQGLANCTLLFGNGDFNTAVAHELGHTLGFRHSDQTRADNANTACSTDPSLECSTQAVMKSFVPSGINAALQAWDVHAVDSVYPGGSCSAPPPPASLPNLIGRAPDFDGDGRSDILWRDASTGQTYIYFMNGLSIRAQVPVAATTDLTWQIVGTGDFDGDGKSDILWRNTSTGQNYVYLMNGAAIGANGVINTVSDQNWKVVGIADFDGDGKADILWRNFSTGQTYIYFMNGLSIRAQTPVGATSDLNWRVAATADFDGDGRADILWRNASTGQNNIYLMGGSTILTSVTINTVSDANWIVAGAADYTGDGRADILWRNVASGTNVLYTMNGTTIARQDTINTAGTQWKVAGTGDYNGDRHADILWRNTSDGTNYAYLMNGAAIGANGVINVVSDQQWNVIQ